MAGVGARAPLALNNPMGASMGGRFNALPSLDAANYSRSPLHAETCAWVEKNCYVDVWIEVLHSLGLEAVAAMSMTVAVDFEGDQWTFFKPSHDDLRELYGIDVQELTVWRGLLAHAQEQLAAGKLISTEADAFWLPDTAGTDYRRQHTKSTIVLADIDVPGQRLGYFHNSGYYELEEEDFRQMFRVDQSHDPTFMPLYAELVKIDRLTKRSDDELRRISRLCLLRQLSRCPSDNPVRRFEQRFARELPLLQQGELAEYHLWAFATIRQLGAAFELAASYVRWCWPSGNKTADKAATSFDRIAQSGKTLILKAARAVNSGRPLEAALLFDDMASSWSAGIEALTLLAATDRYGVHV
jgi:Domain of unknown function (DUF1839)